MTEFELKDIEELEEEQKKHFTLYLTSRAAKELESKEIGSDRWWERLSDYTQIPPEWLRKNVSLNKFTVVGHVGFRQNGSYGIEGYPERMGL